MTKKPKRPKLKPKPSMTDMNPKVPPTNADDWRLYCRSVVMNGTEWGAK